MDPIDLKQIQKAMEDMWIPQEEKFEMTKVLFSLETTCPIHSCGTKDFKTLCYVCPVCGIQLNKTRL